EDGGTHHGVFDIAYLRSIPNVVVASPKDGEELARMMRFSMAHVDSVHASPIAIRYPRGAVSPIDWSVESTPIQLGRSETLVDGEDVALIGFGSTVLPMFEAAKTLRQEGIRATVINARFAKPL